tara:strand:+ start:4891 stop:5139 length:249 start_codon:yes stop_codon:yes gene_type:complete
LESDLIQKLLYIKIDNGESAMVHHFLLPIKSYSIQNMICIIFLGLGLGYFIECFISLNFTVCMLFLFMKSDTTKSINDILFN